MLIGLQEWTTKKKTTNKKMTTKNDDGYVHEEKDYKYYNKLEYEQAYGIIDQEEIEKLFAEPSNVNENNNYNPTGNNNPLAVYDNNYGEKVPDKSTSTGPTRTRTEPEQWTYRHKQTIKSKRVKFFDD